MTDLADRAEAGLRPRATARRTTLLAVVALVLLYGVVIALGDSRVASGSDAGGKLATVVTMADAGTADPDLGYWAEDVDRAGRHHPLWHTTAVGDQWIQATSLPFVVAGAELRGAAGIAGVLSLTVAGGVAAALGARSIARRLGAGEGWWAFALVGAAGPVLVYTGDVWEHAPALGLALLAVALALRADSVPMGLATGALAGLAVVLRAEMVLYGVAFVVATLVVADERRRWRSPRLVVSVALGGAAPVIANGILERVLLDSGVRDGRAGEVVTSVAGHGAGGRVADALITSVGLFPSDDPTAVLLGALTAACLLTVAAWALWPEKVGARAGPMAAVVATLLYGFRLATGVGFVPGFLMVVPIAALGALGARTRGERLLAGTALGVLPLVWVLSWQGNHVAQWGGRYLLLSGALLTIVATSVVHRRPDTRRPAAVLLGLTVVAAGLGAAWHVERTTTVGDAVEAVEAAPADVVVVSQVTHLAREGGAWYGDHRWLRADPEPDVAAPVAVARAEGAERIDLVTSVDGGDPDPAPPDLDGYEPVGAPRRVAWLVGGHLLVQRFEAS